MPTPPPFDPSAEIEWSPVWSLRDERFKYLPTSMLYFFYKAVRRGSSTRIPTAAPPAIRAKKPSSRASSNSLSAMPTRSGGTIDCSAPEVDLGQFDDSYVRDLQEPTGRQPAARLWVLDITSDLGIPSFVAMSHWMQGREGKHRIRFRLAFRRADRHVADADGAESVPVDRPDGRRTGEKSSLDGSTPLRLRGPSVSDRRAASRRSVRIWRRNSATSTPASR